VVVFEPLDAEKILAALNAAKVEYVVIGALAATLQGSPLRTEDLDICPSDRAENLNRLGVALKRLDAKEWDSRKEKFVDRSFDVETLQVDRLWLMITKHGRLDLVFDPIGTGGYQDLSATAVELDVDGLRVKVAHLSDVIRSKEAAGRDKDRHQLPTLRRLLERLQ
jgi:hypothetical protein